MLNRTTQRGEVIRDLGDGLIVRRATPSDAEVLVEFDSHVHSDEGWDEPDESIGLWVSDLLDRPHPTLDVGDFTVVEDTSTGDLVSSQCLIPQAWSYGGIPFSVGKPELIGTHPDYRMRGLTRVQLEIIHEWCAQRNLGVQVIYGIPWFYRRFGYEMALDLDGGRTAYRGIMPKLDDGREEPYRARSAKRRDLPFIADLYDSGRQRNLVSCVRNQALWRYELEGRTAGSYARKELFVIETTAGEPVGFLACSDRLWHGTLGVGALEIKPGVSWLQVVPTALRYLTSVGEGYGVRDARNGFESINLNLGTDHPAYAVASEWLPRVRQPYAWYVRVPDVPAFLSCISPVLERRLAQSPAVGHSGELKISFYESGVRVALENGRVTTVGSWQPADGDRGGVRFPGLTFLQLLFGYRSLEELDYAFADCSVSQESRPLIEALFPKHPSNVWSIA